MKLLKKTLLFAVAALAAAALAAPAMAAASDWTKEGTPIAENQKVSFTGMLTFSGIYGSLGCETQIKSTLKPGGTGTVDSFVINPSFCTGSGIIASCLPTGTMLSAEELPWGFKAENSSEIRLSGMQIRTVFGAKCSVKELLFTGGLVAFPNNPLAISSIAFSAASGTLETNHVPGATTTASGTLNASPAGVYGIK